MQRPTLRRALVLSVALHVVVALIAGRLIVPTQVAATELVDIEVAPTAPLPEALPAEIARQARPDLADPERDHAADPEGVAPSQPGDVPIDAGVDAAPDAAIDARPDAHPDARPDAHPDARPDARPDAADAAPDALPDAGVVADAGPSDPTSDALIVAAIDDAGAADDGPRVALGDADDASLLATGSGAGSAAVASAGAGSAGSGSGSGAGAGAGSSSETGSGSGSSAENGSASVAGAGSGVESGSGSDAGSSAGSALVASAGSGSAARGSMSGAGAASGSASVVGAATGSNGGAGARAGSASAAPPDTIALAAELGAAVPGATSEPAVEGAPTTAGTAANLLTYFPDGHVVTALIRLDRLRGTEWAAQAERLLRPLPDYQQLFGNADAAITEKLETLVISTPRPRDAAATTLVARTTLARRPLRDFLGAVAPVTWSATRGGLLGKRASAAVRGDHRVILSPFRGWFLLAQPADLGALATAAKGNLETVEATGKLPPWLAGIRKIESETGDKRGPAVVLTLGLGGKRIDLAGRDFGLGIASVPTPDRVSLAAELVPQGWLVRGNLRFASEADATELIATVQRIQQRVADSYAIRLVLGKPIARVVANLAFARNGARVSYATSMSIADARAILAVAALQLDQYFGRAP